MITVDESWMYGYNLPETKAQLSVKVIIVYKTKESKTSDEQSESDTGCFFFSITMEFCITNRHQKGLHHFAVQYTRSCLWDHAYEIM